MGRTELSAFETAGGNLEEIWRRSDYRHLRETEPDQQPQPVANPLCGPYPELFGHGTGVSPVRPGLIVPSDCRAKAHRSSHDVLYSHGPL